MVGAIHQYEKFWMHRGLSLKINGVHPMGHTIMGPLANIPATFSPTLTPALPGACQKTFQP